MEKKKKFGGMKKGYKFTKTVEFSFRCDEKDFIIVEEFIKLYKSTHDQLLKFEILKEMAKYRYAIPKDNEPVSAKEDSETGAIITINDILHSIDVTPKAIDAKKP